MKGEIIVKEKVVQYGGNRQDNILLRVDFHNSEYLLHEIERINNLHEIDGKKIFMTIVLDKSEPVITFDTPFEEIEDPAKRFNDLSEHEKLIEKIINSENL